MRRNGIGIRTAQLMSERIVGQIHVYDGASKGKSQAALGVVLRSIGLGIHSDSPTRVLLLRFLKGPDRSYDEDAAIEALQKGFPHLIDQVRTGRSEYFGPDEIIQFDHQEARRGWDVAKGAIASDLYSVVVLDELNPVLDLGLLPVDEVIHTIKNKPEQLEVIATGRAAPQALLDIADLHSEMKPHQHSTTQTHGIAGIELIIQWLKGGIGYTEDAAIAALRQSYPNLVDHQRCGGDAIVWRGQQKEIDFVEAERGWEIARAAIASGLYKTIILDELNPTVDLELLPVKPIVEALLRKPKDTEVIITGRCLNPPDYFDLASVHSEVFCHKHYANHGVELKRGVDF